MKITHKPYNRSRIGKTVHISEVQDGECFIPSTWSGGCVCFLWKGARYNLHMFGTTNHALDSAREWEYKCKKYSDITARIVSPPSKYLDKINKIKNK